MKVTMGSAPDLTQQDTPLGVVSSHPRLIFFTRLEPAPLQEMLAHDSLLDELVLHSHGLAVAMIDLTDGLAEVIRQLNTHGIYTVAWLLLPMDDGCWFNAQNYPQAIEHYRAFRAWAYEHRLHIDAVGMDIKPPIQDVKRVLQRRLWEITWRLAHDNVLYPTACMAYSALAEEIRRDGYPLHTYQLPVVADDRRAGTTLMQRMLDVVDIPSDVEVFMCFSSLPVENLQDDMGGSLIMSYRSATDSIAIGSVGTTSVHDGIGEKLLPLSWESFQRDLLLAARYTDTLYVFSLEGCVESGFLPNIARMDWSSEAQAITHRRLLVDGARSALFAMLLGARFYRTIFALSGWVVAFVLLLRRLKQHQS